MRKNKRLIAACALLALAVGLIALGVLDGGFTDVLNKARLICWECIGIG